MWSVLNANLYAEKKIFFCAREQGSVSWDHLKILSVKLVNLCFLIPLLISSSRQGSPGGEISAEEAVKERHRLTANSQSSALLCLSLGSLMLPSSALNDSILPCDVPDPTKSPIVMKCPSFIHPHLCLICARYASSTGAGTTVKSCVPLLGWRKISCREENSERYRVRIPAVSVDMGQEPEDSHCNDPGRRGCVRRWWQIE